MDEHLKEVITETFGNLEKEVITQSIEKLARNNKLERLKEDLSKKEFLELPYIHQFHAVNNGFIDATCNGHLEVVKFLYEYRLVGIDTNYRNNIFWHILVSETENTNIMRIADYLIFEQNIPFSENIRDIVLESDILKNKFDLRDLKMDLNQGLAEKLTKTQMKV